LRVGVIPLVLVGVQSPVAISSCGVLDLDVMVIILAGKCDGGNANRRSFDSLSEIHAARKARSESGELPQDDSFRDGVKLPDPGARREGGRG
jgi:hypothetical protein